MPTYIFKTKNDEFQEYVMKISELDEFKKNNPELSQVPTASKVVHEIGTNLKVPDFFRDRVSEIKSKVPHNNIKDY